MYFRAKVATEPGEHYIAISISSKDAEQMLAAMEHTCPCIFSYPVFL